MNVLALNCGSSSVKFRLVAVEPGAPAAAGRALAERTEAVRDGDHASAVQHALELARSAGPIEAVGHRIVHGGPRFTAPALIDDAVIEAIEALETLAPLHNRPSLAGIRACRVALGAATPMVAVFDTAFHAGLPERAARYAIPWDLAERHGIRRYGFHGISYAWATQRTATLLGRPVSDLKLVVLHLGSGCSAAAIRGGASVDTSMGLTPLEGLVMGTRSGDMDPAIIDHVASKEGYSSPEVEGILNKQSGLLGVSGLTNDMRELLAEEAEHGDRRARLAIDLFAYRARKYIGAYLAAMNGADALIFAGGIGENASSVRARICDGLQWMGIELDSARNEQTIGGKEGRIDREGSRVEVWVIPTDEELLIARDTVRVVLGIDHQS